MSCESASQKQYAEVAELADAQASGACGSNTVRVQVPPSALFIFSVKELAVQAVSSFLSSPKKHKKTEEKLFQAPLLSYSCHYMSVNCSAIITLAIMLT